MDDTPQRFVMAVLHAFVPVDEPDTAQAIARSTLAALLESLWGDKPRHPQLSDLRACIAEAQAAGQAHDPAFVFTYDPLLVGVKPFDWAALAA